MMKKYFLIILVFGYFSLGAQNAYQSVVDQIEANSTMLSAFRSNAEASKAENYAGSLFENPKLELGYLFGLSDGSKHRVDLKINQEFDFPTVYTNKSKIRKMNNEVFDLEYEIHRNEIFYQIRMICTDLVFNNLCLEYHEHCVENAKIVEKAMEKKLEIGEATILEYRNAKMNYLSVKNEYDMHVIERERLLSELCVLNGGNEIDFRQDFYEDTIVPEDFDKWYENIENASPVFVHLAMLNNVDQQKVKLAKSNWVPKLNVGYMMENENDGGYHGPTIGLSLPFWGNARTVKAAKAKALSSDEMLKNNRVLLRNELYNTYTRAKVLYSNYSEMKAVLDGIDSSELLLKALEKGELTLVEYLVELENQHDAALKVFKMQHEFQRTIVELKRFGM